MSAKQLTNVNINIDERLLDYFTEIKKLKEENEELTISIKLFEDDVKRLTTENEELKQQLDKIPPKIREIWL